MNYATNIPTNSKERLIRPINLTNLPQLGDTDRQKSSTERLRKPPITKEMNLENKSNHVSFKSHI